MVAWNSQQRRDTIQVSKFPAVACSFHCAEIFIIGAYERGRSYI
jgi:hypothetical protein